VTIVTGIIEAFPENGRAVGQPAGPPNIPVGGVVVAVWGTPFSAVSDPAGRFIIDNVPEGRHRLVITVPGHDSRSMPEVNLLAGRPFDLAVLLSTTLPPRSSALLPCSADGRICGLHPGPLLTHGLVIVDGLIKLDEDTVPGIASLDIQRMQVLVGAAAAPLYGQKAAMGAVVIETRRERFSR
jgi:TonB-dependent SusC/RagA subfamily outer membrane receptor